MGDSRLGQAGCLPQTDTLGRSGQDMSVIDGGEEGIDSGKRIGRGVTHGKGVSCRYRMP
ncbi:hypothetical protein [Streptomyces sp. NPDC056013]|uniref:hypothetical protein n=1 Tax=Streptomyces sp. NPDC056013 TaxID=3345680 RepID=UPI0035DA5BC2